MEKQFYLDQVKHILPALNLFFEPPAIFSAKIETIKTQIPPTPYSPQAKHSKVPKLKN